MSKKYKLKRKKKNLISYYIIIIIIVFSVFSATGYALFSDNLTISGTANIKVSGSDEPELEYGNSTYTWSLQDHWGSEGNYTYHFAIDITNLDGDLFCTNGDNVEFRITLTNSTSYKPWPNLSSYNLWNADTVDYENGVLIIKLKQDSIWWSNGSSMQLFPMLCLETEEDIVITSIALNGKLCTDVTNTSSSQ